MASRTVVCSGEGTHHPDQRMPLPGRGQAFLSLVIYLWMHTPQKRHLGMTLSTWETLEVLQELTGSEEHEHLTAEGCASIIPS